MARILLVEDEVIISLTTSMLLEEEGFAVDVATDGVEALEMARANPPDVIVTDYMMPRMDGLAFIVAVRASGWSGPIVLVSALPEVSLSRNYPGGHDAYLSKPYTIERLASLVRQLVADRADGSL